MRLHPVFSLLATAHAVAVMLGSSPTAWAQTAPSPPSAGDVLRQNPPPQAPRSAVPALPEVRPPALPAPLQALPGGPTVVVKRVAVEGNRVLSTELLERQVASAAGSSMSLAEMEALATRLTLFYRSRGYFVARAYVPAQDLTDGRLVLQVVEGNYGRFVLDNRSRVRDATVQGLLDDIKDRDIVSFDTLERAMLIINDTPGVRVSQADVMPGQAVGTSDFAIGTVATARFTGYGLVDNYGSRYTGRQRLSFGADWNSPSGRGDRLALSGLSSTSTELVNLRLAYGALVAANGTRVEASLARTQYELGDIYTALDAVGTADSAELAVTTPWKRTRNASIEWGATLAHRSLEDETRSASLVVRKRSDAVAFKVGGDRTHTVFGLDGSTQFSGAVTVGDLSFADPVAAAQDAVGARTAGSWSKLNVMLARTTALPADLQLRTSAKAQVALERKNLDGSERMSVSGPGAVMAYPSGELAGDDALVLRAELTRPLGMVGEVRFIGGLHGAWGLARVVQPLLPQGRTGHLGDGGLSLDAVGPGWVARATVAHRLHGGDARSEPASATRLLLQAGVTF